METNFTLKYNEIFLKIQQQIIQVIEPTTIYVQVGPKQNVRFNGGDSTTCKQHITWVYFDYKLRSCHFNINNIQLPLFNELYLHVYVVFISHRLGQYIKIYVISPLQNVILEEKIIFGLKRYFFQSMSPAKKIDNFLCQSRRCYSLFTYFGLILFQRPFYKIRMRGSKFQCLSTNLEKKINLRWTPW